MPFKNPHPLYSVWQSMLGRCRNKNHPSYHRYGGRGITVCDRWKDFKTFASDMGERPVNFSIERINNNLGYCPENCKWASRKDQQRNQSCTRVVEIEGVAYKAAELSDITGMKTDTIVNRAAKGLSLQEVLSSEKMVFKEGLALGGMANGARKKAMTHCAKGHEFTPKTTYVTPQGWRTCRTCRQQRLQRRRQLGK